MPLRPCIRCGVLVSKGSYCPAHHPDRGRPRTTPGRGGGTAAARFRKAVLARAGGRCAVCGTTEGVEAHHLIPLAKGGTNDPATNGVALCRRHHRQVEGHPAAQ